MTPTIAPWIRLVREGPPATLPSARCVFDVVLFIAPYAAALPDVEVFWVLTLDTGSNITGIVEITRGILNASLVHPREVFRAAIAHGAAGIILAHNHPSGDPTPSPDDRAITKQLVESGRLLGIPVYDHVIIGHHNRHISFAETGIL